MSKLKPSALPYIESIIITAVMIFLCFCMYHIYEHAVPIKDIEMEIWSMKRDGVQERSGWTLERFEDELSKEVWPQRAWELAAIASIAGGYFGFKFLKRRVAANGPE